MRPVTNVTMVPPSGCAFIPGAMVIACAGLVVCNFVAERAVVAEYGLDAEADKSNFHRLPSISPA